MKLLPNPDFTGACRGNAEWIYTKDADNAAEVAAKAIPELHGNTPRLYRNTLVFLAADKVRLQDLDEAWRKLQRPAGPVNSEPIPNHFTATETAVLIVHPLGIDEGQSWTVSEPAQDVDLCQPEKIISRPASFKT